MQAAVLIGLVQRHELMVLLTQRTADMTTHAGQVAFPGGKVDPQDRDAVAAALREAHEETGLPVHGVSVLGALPDYTTGTNFQVSPVVALIEPGFSLKANPIEVADIFEVPLSFLMNPRNHHYHQLRWEDNIRHWYSMPYLDHDANGQPQERFIWGATAGMLRNLYRFLSA
jgi:8-oxo-dGTP pyrophosphatase MutT (NUDIX family)